MSNWIFSWFNWKQDVKSGILSIDGSYDTREGFDKSADFVVAGAEVNLSLLEAKQEYRFGELALNGPNGGVDLSLKSKGGVAAMVEASAAKAEATCGPLYVSANLNANTGIKLGRNGAQFGFLGFGLTLGIGGKWTIDTPFGSAGGATSSIVLTNSRKVLAD
jgi:hypothetical protein